MKHSLDFLELTIEKIYEAIEKKGEQYYSMEKGNTVNQTRLNRSGLLYQIDIDESGESRKLVINAGGNDRVECNIDVSEKDDRKTVVSYGYHPDKEVFSNFINRHNDEIDQLLKSAKDEQ